MGLRTIKDLINCRIKIQTHVSRLYYWAQSNYEIEPESELFLCIAEMDNSTNLWGKKRPMRVDLCSAIKTPPGHSYCVSECLGSSPSFALNCSLLGWLKSTYPCRPGGRGWLGCLPPSSGLVQPGCCGHLESESVDKGYNKTKI